MPVCIDCQSYPCACPFGYSHAFQCLTCYTTPCVCPPLTTSDDSTKNHDTFSSFCSSCEQVSCVCVTCPECGWVGSEGTCNCAEIREADENLEYLKSLFRRQPSVCVTCPDCDGTLHYCYDCNEYHYGEHTCPPPIICPCSECEKYKAIIKMLLEDY